jgi:hypothetical protein
MITLLKLSVKIKGMTKIIKAVVMEKKHVIANLK